MKRTHHRIVSVFLFVIWLILFILMQFVSFDWSNKNELRLCLQMIGLFFLQFPVIRCFQKQRASRIILAFSVLYGVFLMIKDVCFILAVVRPNWHGPLALFFTCLMCDLVGFIRCRRSFKRLSQADSFSTQQIDSRQQIISQSIMRLCLKNHLLCIVRGNTTGRLIRSMRKRWNEHGTNHK